MRATCLAYVRTNEGVVQVHDGDPVPDGADTEHLEQLVEAGVFAASSAEQDGPAGQAAPPAEPVAPPAEPAEPETQSQAPQPRTKAGTSGKTGSGS